MPALEGRAPGPAGSILPRLVTLLVAVAAGCAVTQPTLKIGLVAPFEGRYRAIGYDVIYAARLAVREANAAGGIAGYWIELVSLDDSGDTELAAQQVAKLAVDPSVMAVVGHWLPDTTQASLDGYAQAGLPLAATGGQAAADAGVALVGSAGCLLWPPGAGCAPEWPRAPEPGQTVCTSAPLPADSADPDFARRYRVVSQGVGPEVHAVIAYDSVQMLLAAIAQAADGQPPTRAAVAAALRATRATGLAGTYAFAADGSRSAPPAWAYEFVRERWQPLPAERTCATSP